MCGAAGSEDCGQVAIAIKTIVDECSAYINGVERSGGGYVSLPLFSSLHFYRFNEALVRYCLMRYQLLIYWIVVWRPEQRYLGFSIVEQIQLRLITILPGDYLL